MKTDRFLSEIRRVLKPSGYALISTNNLASWHNIASLVLGMQPMPNHVSDLFVVGNRFDPRRGLEHAEKGFSHLRIFAFQGLREMLELHRARRGRARHERLLPLPPRLADAACKLDPRHGAYLIARCRPGDRAPGVIQA